MRYISIILDVIDGYETMLDFHFVFVKLFMIKKYSAIDIDSPFNFYRNVSYMFKLS